MRSRAFALLSAVLCITPGVLCAQVAPTGGGATTAAAAPAVVPAGFLSDLVQPALTNLQRTLGTVDVEKWKLSRPARDDARRNVDSIRQDITTTLPPLMSAGDAAPGSVPAEFAMLRNVDALYDVALRLSATATLAAPPAQAAALDQALGDLLQARRSLGDRTQADATTQQRTLAEMGGKVRAAAAAAPACPPAPAPVETKAKPRRAKQRPKPQPLPPQ